MGAPSSGLLAVLALLCVASCAACEGGGAPRAETAPPTSRERQADDPGEPGGQAQGQLPLGTVVLETPPRAPVEVTVEVADTDETRRRGLMFREQLGENEGMFFVFPTERVQSFWMRNTLIPLDMLFIDEGFEVVGVVENAEPQTDTPRGVDRPSRYVLEVNAGFAREHGLGPGTRVRYTPPAGAAAEEEP